MKISPFSLGLAAVAFASSALAGPRPSGGGNLADLTVSITAPAGVYVYQPGTYSVVVSNIGNRNADATVLTIGLPATGTSPVVHVLGELGAFDNRCSLAGTELVCALGQVRRGTSTTVQVTIELPQSAAPLVVTADVETTTAERSNTNNSDADTAYLLHPSRFVSVGENAHVEHCTGTGLVSFYECTLYPSSISTHDFEFLAGNLLAFTNPSGTTYWGEWEQNGTGDELDLRYHDGATKVAEFHGVAVGGDCFEGVTQFFPPGSYVAPYRVCVQ